MSEGFYDPVWQNKARLAMQERHDGKFDDYLKHHIEDMFGDGSEAASQGQGQDVHSLHRADNGRFGEQADEGEKRAADSVDSADSSSDSDYVNDMSGKTKRTARTRTVLA